MLIQEQFSIRMECVEFLECVTSLVTKVKQRLFCFQTFMSILYCSRHKWSFVFKHLCKYCIVLKHLCKYCTVLNTQRIVIKRLSQQTHLFYCLLICVQMCDVRKLVQQHLYSCVNKYIVFNLSCPR